MSRDTVSLDPLIHAPVRLAILSILMATEHADFTYLRDETGATEGNLSTHLTKLENAGLVKIKKTFQGKRPRTVCSITAKGRKSFEEYVNNLEKILSPERQ